MIGRVIEIASEGCHLARDRGLLTVSKDGGEVGRVPLDDIGVLILDARGLTYSHGLMVELAGRNITAVLCNKNHIPVSWLWPLAGHHVQARRMRVQLAVSRPVRKRIWQAIVRAKITGQGATLEMLQLPADGFDALARRVRSGDPANVEAQAARNYWPLLFGPDFRRARFGEWPNPLLNYGYTVLRAAVARSVVATGLHPSMGIHHHNRANAMCLVDDLMEPFRPLVDYRVVRLVTQGSEEVTSDEKKSLAGILTMEMVTDRGTTPLQTCLDRAAQSLAKSFENGKPNLSFPSSPVASFVEADSVGA